MESNTNLTERIVRHKHLVGSIHRSRNGYGNGGTVSTARNTMTKPITVAPSRYPKDYNNEIKEAKPILLIDRNNNKRYAEQVIYQTSGEYGKFLLGLTNEKVLLNMQPLDSKAIATKPITQITHISK